jgi:ABC-type branched-subunit amino acid transport system substrate-binding protein
MHVRNRRLARRVWAAAAIGLTAATALSTVAGAQASEEPGVTAKSVKLGYIFSETGVASAIFKNAGKACQARVDRQNAQGGVNGRKIDLEILDDQSGAPNQTAAKDLVENQDVFAVINNSSFGFLTYRYLLDAGVPMIGGGYDGTYYSQKGNEDVVSMAGNALPLAGLTYDSGAKIMKSLGAKKVAALAYGASASSVASAKAFMDYAAPSVGLDPVYTNTSVDFGTTDTGPLVLGIKNAGADGVYLPLQSSTNLAVIQGLAQNGVEMKAAISATGYGQDLLDSPAAQTLTPSTVFSAGYAPVELKTKATKQFQADLKKYAGVSGVPDYGDYTGYIICDLAITGLQEAGKNPTRRGFIDGMRTLDAYDQAGLACQPVSLTLADYGKSADTGCGWTVQVKDGKFVVMNKGKPFTGKLVGSKEALAANKTGNAASVTTTTAAPAP